jgi:phosphatidyl-myo-inositol alpha-mannosyltransferase
MISGRVLRIGIVCPYSLDVPGGVQSHVLDLARALIALGHSVSVLAPADDDRPDGEPPLPAFVTPAGRAMSVPYNGSVARITFGPLSYARVRRWLADHTFDVLHLHEPGTFSLSSLALFEAEGPIVATFHTSTERSRATLVFARPINALMEKVTARIAVSPMARRVQVEHLGGDAVEIPNGVDVSLFASGPLLPGYPRDGHTVGFLGRFGEPRKGMAVLLEALRLLVPQRPDLRLLVVGRGDAEALRREAGPELAERLDILGGVDDVTKAAALRSMDVYCAPNTGGESFGMVLTEAMAAGTAVLASDLGAFRAVLQGDDGSADAGSGSDGPGTAAGVLFPTGQARPLASALAALLDDPQRRAALGAQAQARAAAFDWPVVAADVLRVYRAAIAADPRRVPGRTVASTR